MNKLTKEDLILRTLKENPDLDYDFIEGLIEGLEEILADKTEEYDEKN